MAYVDEAVFTAATGYIYTAAVGTEVPDLTNFDPETFEAQNTDWETVGYTSEEELPEFGYEGGESTPKGSWQRKNMRQITTETPVDYVTFKLHQWTKESLEMYYGPNASVKPGRFGIDRAGETVQKALLIVLVDGTAVVGFTSAKNSIGRDESIGLATDDFATLPVRATMEKHPGHRLFEWILPEASDPAA